MSGGSKPKMPVPSPAPSYAPISPEIAQKAEDRRKKMLAALGRKGTILAGALGDTEGNLSSQLGGG